MTAAVALAVVLVIAVAGLSLAMQTQRPVGPQQGGGPRPRPTPPTPRRSRERRAQPAAETPPPTPPPVPEPASRGPELLRTGAQAQARVVSVVDERTVGPVTRSRLTLEITPKGGDAFQVTIRAAFPSPASRAAVKVGGTVPVRYDPDDHGRVVLDLASEGSKGRGGAVATEATSSPAGSASADDPQPKAEDDEPGTEEEGGGSAGS